MLLTVDQANSEDLSVVLGILDEAAAWLQSKGIQQWPAQFGGVDDWRSTRIASYIDGGECWIVRAGGEPIATFNVTTSADPDYADGWPDGPSSALYIFRMGVCRAWQDATSARVSSTGPAPEHTHSTSLGYVLTVTGTTASYSATTRPAVLSASAPWCVSSMTLARPTPGAAERSTSAQLEPCITRQLRRVAP